MQRNIDNTKVSVIIPTFNRAELLPRAIKSVLDQKFQDFELIIVDDGSSDNTAEVVKDLQKKDERISFFSQDNQGSAGARNFGIKNSKGEFIAFLDSDDEWLPQKLERQIEYLHRNREIKLVGCGSYDINSKTYEKRKFIPKTKTDSFKNGLIVFEIHSASSVILRKDVLKKMELFDKKLRISEDRDLWLRILENGDEIGFVKEPLFNYYIHDSNIGSRDNYLKKIDCFKYLAEKHQDRFPLVASRLLRNVGTFYVLNDEKMKAISSFGKAIKKAPFVFRNYINLLLAMISLRLYKRMYKKICC